MPPPYRATVPSQATSFTYGGTEYDGGSTFRSEDPCQMLGFAQAYKAANPQGGRRNATPNFWQEMQAACPAGPATTPTAAPATAPVEANPAPAGGDSGTNQGAPALQSPPTEGGETNPGGSTTDPAPGEEPRRPPPGEPDPAVSQERPQAQTGSGDPVDIFSGSMYLQETDLEVPNSTLPLSLIRSYRSGVAVFGPFGWNWDHNFNLFVRELNDGSVSLWRSLHEDVFRPAGPDLEPPPGIFERLERLPGPAPRYDLTAEGGNRMRFERPPGWVDGERIPLIRIEDRHGNAITLTYDTLDRVADVRDDDARFLHFDYDTCGLLVAVSDHAGRRYSYEHDEQAMQLVSVTTPATADQPAGIERCYEYAEAFAPPTIRHNIVSVEDSDGNVYLENRYDEDPASLGFGRVVEQYYGGYLFQFQYSQIQWVPPDAVFINIPAVQVEVMNPDFGVETYTFNYRGDLLDRRFRLNKDHSFRVIAIQYELDDQGNLTTTTRPDGSQEIRTYDNTNADPRMRGKLLGRELTAAAGFPVPSRIVWRGRYEPTYQLLVDERDETGALTAYRYDFDVTPGSATNTGKLKEIRHPDATLPDGTNQPAIVRFEHNARGQVTAIVQPDGSREEMEYGLAGNGRGRLVRRVLDAAGLGIVNLIGYDAFGFDSTQVDGNGATTAKTVNALGLMESESLPAVGGVDIRYVLHYSNDRRVVRVERPRGAYANAGLPGDWIEDVVERDVLGHPVRCEMGSNTAEGRVYRTCFDFRGFPLRITNPDGSRLDRRYDERGLLLEETVTGGDGTRRATRRSYDRIGQVRRVVAPGGATTTYEYDGFGRLREMVIPNGSTIRYRWLPGDVIGQVECVGADGFGATRRLEMVSFAYDERLRLTASTIESFRDDPAISVPLVTSYTYDAAGRLVKEVDPRGGIVVTTRDGLGRITVRTDPLGNEERSSYDGNSNLIRTETSHREPDGTVSVRSRTFAFDTRNRQTAIVESDGGGLAYEYDARDLLVSRTDYLGRVRRTGYNAFGDRIEETYLVSGGQIVHRWELDQMSRLIAYTDPTGEVSRYTLDGIGRVVGTQYPNGFSATRQYDEAGNVIEERIGATRFAYAYDAANRLTQMTNPAVGGAIVGVANHVYGYDGLDRLTSATVGPRQVVRRYDSLGRIVREETLGVAMTCVFDDLTGDVSKTWPDGRVERHRHDLNGAVVRIEETAHGALGTAGGLLASFVPSGPGHFGTAQYQGNLRLTAGYDDRKRLVELAATSPAGLAQTISYRYDTANTRRLEAIDGANPLMRSVDHDERYRLSRAREGHGVALSVVTTQADHDGDVAAADAAAAAAPVVETFSYDAADARLTHARTAMPSQAYTYLPGHRPQTDGIEGFTYSSEGVMASDGSFAYQADALGRIVALTDAAGSCSIEYDALGRPSSVSAPGQPDRSFSYLADNVEQEADNGVAVRQSTLDATGAPIAYHVGGATHYALFDGRRNLVGLADSAGALLESYRYAPFGVPVVLDPTGGVRPQSAFGVDPVFGGLRFLPAVERYLATRRLMNPEHGILLSPDPLGYAGSASLYVYAGQDPIDLVDPDGEFPFLAILAVMAVGALVSGGLNATRQGIQMAEDPRRRREGFSWGELGTSMGIGAVLAPVLVVAPELAIPLAGYGVYGGVEQMREGNYATGTFDIVTSLAPFGSRTVRNASVGRGTVIGQARGLGPAAPWSVRTGRFTLVENNLPNFAPSPFGRRVGLGFSRSAPGATEGHTAVIIERPEGGFWFVEKNAGQLPDGSLIANFRDAPTPLEFYMRRTSERPFEYDSIRVPRQSASEAMNYAQDRTGRTFPEPFDQSCANCSHFAGDVLARAGFRGMGNGRASGLFSDFTNFNAATTMSYAAPFWARLPEPGALSK